MRTREFLASDEAFLDVSVPIAALEGLPTGQLGPEAVPLQLLDTPGPNEAGEESLKFQVLHSAHASCWPCALHGARCHVASCDPWCVVRRTRIDIQLCSVCPSMCSLHFAARQELPVYAPFLSTPLTLEQVERLLDSVDAVIYILDYTKLKTQEEADLLGKLKARLCIPPERRTCTLCTWCDLIAGAGSRAPAARWRCYC